MSGAQQFLAIEHAMSRLAELAVIPRIAPALGRSARRAAQALRNAVVAEVPAFATSGNPEIMPGLERLATQHVGEIRSMLKRGKLSDFVFVRAHSQQLAEQRFPLDAMLHAYRCGHRVIAHWLRDAINAPGLKSSAAIAALADFAIEYTNITSTILAAEYVARTRVLAEAEGDRRTELLNILLNGYDEADGRVARLLKRAGYGEQRQSFCVALAQSADPAEMESPARVQRIADAITSVVAPLRIRILVGIRNNVVTAVFSDTRRLSGWTAPQTKLTRRVQPALLTLGPAVLIGVSSDQPSTAFIPRALREASVALDFASVAERVVSFIELPIRRLLLHRAGDYVQSAMPAWISDFSAADAKLGGVLLKTLRAYADTDMNVLQAARALRVHPNTVYARMQRVNALTGRDTQKYHVLTELLLAADCMRV